MIGRLAGLFLIPGGSLWFSKVMSPGTQLGRYKIVEHIAAGGMGEVYLAHDPHLDRRVAVKVLPARLAADAVARERLRREALAAAALDHPYICKLFDIGEEHEVLFLVMEFIDGANPS